MSELVTAARQAGVSARDASGRGPRPRPGVWTAALVLLVLAAYALVVPIFFGHESRLVDYATGARPPSAEHWLGTDSEGRDLFFRVAAGLRLSLTIAGIVALVATAVGVTVGLVAGFCGGLVDQVLMRFGDGLNALPHLVLGLVIVAMFRGSIPALVIAMVVTLWVTIARVVRAQTLALRRSERVDAAWLSGMDGPRIVWFVLLPAALGQACISVVLTVPHIVWHESTFSFLGLGLPPHEPSLGTLLADAEGGLLRGEWWLLAFPAGALVAATLAIAVLGRALTDRINGTEHP